MNLINLSKTHGYFTKIKYFKFLMEKTNNIQIILREANTDDVYELRKCNKSCLPVYYSYDIYQHFITVIGTII